MVGVLDRNPHRLERFDRLLAPLGGHVERGQVEVAAAVEDLRSIVVLEVEVLELGADVERVEAHERIRSIARLKTYARIALVGRRRPA